MRAINFQQLAQAIWEYGGTRALSVSTVINSIQYGSISFPTSDGSEDATVTAVDTAKSALIFLGFTANSYSVDHPRITLLNSTTVRATRAVADANTVVVNFCLVEFK
jgi:hypothetical protein